jgi:hypothetical protein
VEAVRPVQVMKAAIHVTPSSVTYTLNTVAKYLG